MLKDKHHSSVIISTFAFSLGLPDSSVDKESACNAGDPGSIPGSGISTGEGIGYPLQYSCHLFDCNIHFILMVWNQN